MKQDITTDLADIKKIVREHYGQCFTQIFDNLDEMNQFFIKHKLLKFTQYKIS